MRKLFIIFVLLLLAASVQAQLDTREDVRLAVYQDCNLDSVGTNQATVAQVNNLIGRGYQVFGAHLYFEVVPYKKTDTFNLVNGQGYYDTVLNSDYVERPLLRCQKGFVETSSGTSIRQAVATVPNDDIVTVKAGEAPKYVLASHGMIEVYPVPTGTQAYLILYFEYQAHPPELTADTSSILIDESLRQPLVDWVNWHILDKVRRHADADRFKARLPRSLTQRQATRTTTEEVIQ